MSTTANSALPIPPIGVKISADTEHRRSGVCARARWTNPVTKERETRAQVVANEEAAKESFQALRRSSELGVDVTVPRGEADHHGRAGEIARDQAVMRAPNRAWSRLFVSAANGQNGARTAGVRGLPDLTET